MEKVPGCEKGNIKNVVVKTSGSHTSGTVSKRLEGFLEKTMTVIPVEMLQRQHYL